MSLLQGVGLVCILSKNNHYEKKPSQKELDQAVKKLQELMRSGKFKAGIYNYCDRWCKKCPDTKKCLVYAQEEMLIKY